MTWPVCIVGSCLQITYSGQEKGMATIDAQDPRNQAPRARIAHVIQMNLDSPNKLQAAFKRAFGALLAIDNKEFLDVRSTHALPADQLLYDIAWPHGCSMALICLLCMLVMMLQMWSAASSTSKGTNICMSIGST